MVGIETRHQFFAAADHSDGHSTGHRLPVHDHVRLHAEVLLRSAGGQAKPAEHLVENERDAVLAAHGAQVTKPFSVGGRGVGRVADSAGQQDGIARRG